MRPDWSTIQSTDHGRARGGGRGEVPGDTYPFSRQIDTGCQSGGTAQAAQRALEVGLLQQLPLVRGQTCRIGEVR